MTAVTVTSTATQTLDDGRSLDQWRSIQGRFWTELQKNATQFTVCPRQAKGLLWLSLSDSAAGADERAPPEYCSGRVHLQQELWRGNCALFLSACAAAPKKWRRARRSGRPVKQVCSDTIEELISSTDELTRQTESALGSTKDHHQAPPHASDSAPPGTFTSPFQQQHLSPQNLSQQWPRRLVFFEASETNFIHELTRPVPALLNTRKYAGTRVGEAQSPGPATRERDWTVTEQPDATHRRINEVGDSVRSSQDSVTRAVQNLRISDSLRHQRPSQPAPKMGNFRRQPQPKHTIQGAQGIPSLCAVRPSRRLES